MASALAGALALPLLIAPTTAAASCNDRKVAGTVVGGVGGALIGNSIAHGGAGAVLGGLGGAVVGHEVARSTCNREHYHSRSGEYQGASRPHEHGYASTSPYDAQSAQAPPPQPTYYDDRGAIVQPASPASYAASAYPAAPSAPTGYGGYGGSPPACSAASQPYYNDRGELVQVPVQACAR
jgi:hypothetical protein